MRATAKTPGSTIFLGGAEYLNWNVRWILGYQGGGELRMAFERGEADLYATANLVALRELIGGGFRSLTQQGKLTGTGTFQRTPEFKEVPTFDVMLAADDDGGRVGGVCHLGRDWMPSADRSSRRATPR